MEIPVDVDVVCEGVVCGRSQALVLNPVTDRVTHLVVRDREAPHTERLVPVDAVGSATREDIALNIPQSKLRKAEPFQETHFLPVTFGRYLGGNSYSWPYVVRMDEHRFLAETEERIPAGEVAVRRGAQVLAKEGPVGKVDEFVVRKADCHVTHLVMREGHLWGKREVAIPVGKVEQMNERSVYLALTKKEIEALPAVPVDRQASRPAKKPDRSSQGGKAA